MRMEIADSIDGFVPSSAEAEPWWHEFRLPVGADEGDIQVIDRAYPGPGMPEWAGRRTTTLVTSWMLGRRWRCT